MWGFLFAVLSLLERTRKKIVDRTKKSLKVSDALAGKIDTRNNDEIKKKSKVHDLRSKVFAIISATVIFFETLPLLMYLLLVVIVLICIVGLVLVVLVVMNTVTGTTVATEEEFQPGTEGVGTSIRGELAFTDAELGTYGLTLTAYEKNLYRMGILSRKASEGYGGYQYLEQYDIAVNSHMLMGISSVETGMNFYVKDKDRDITKFASDIPGNGSGYGFLGLSTTKEKLANLDVKAKDDLTKQYYPENVGAMKYEAQYAPWATYFSIRHLSSKNTVVVKYLPEARKILDEWGLMANRKENEDILAHLMLQSAYHGVNFKDEMQAYGNFWAALLHATSDVDAERSFDKWSIPHSDKTSYAESAFRISMFGNTPIAGIYLLKNGYKDMKGMGTPITLNGTQLSEPLWKYIGVKYIDGGTPQQAKGVGQSWSKLLYFSRQKASGSSVGDRALNFHYGYNSYLQSTRVKVMLKSKMKIPTPVLDKDIKGEGGGSVAIISGKFTVKAGQTQGTINGQPVSDYLADYYSKKGSKKFYNSLKDKVGTASALTDAESSAYGKVFKYNSSGAPFYHQGGGNETYGKLPYAPGSSTFDWAGCAVYSVAYSATAMTGKLINPAEMALLMGPLGAMTDGGMTRDNLHSTILNKMGVSKAVFYQSSKANNWAKAKSHLKSGGIVIARFTAPYASSSNHYLVLTGVHTENGVTKYSMYSSSSIKDSMRLHTDNELYKALRADKGITLVGG